MYQVLRAVAFDTVTRNRHNRGAEKGGEGGRRGVGEKERRRPQLQIIEEKHMAWIFDIVHKAK
jgi:hypothetical protein